MAELYGKLQELFPNDDERGKIWAALLSKGAEDRPLYFLGGDAAARSALGSLLPSPVGSAAVEFGAGDGKSKAKDKLIDIFGKQLKESRTALWMPERRREDGPLPPKFANFGNLFTLKGRDETLQELIVGAARLFATFMDTETLQNEWRRKDFFMMLVTYPGAGKTTAGSCLSALLREYWCMHKDNENFRLRLNDELGTLDNFVKFTEMVENVLDLNFEARMFHALDSIGGGKLLPAEHGLDYPQILALRCLHSAIVPTRLAIGLETADRDASYDHMLAKIDYELPGFKQVLLLDDVIDTIRLVLEIPAEKQIFLSWFIDEVNSASTGPDGLTWMQHVLSAYVDWMTGFRAGKTFTMLTLATTRFSAVSLVGTVSGNAQKIYIPVRPLLKHEACEVVRIFFQRLSMGTSSSSQIEVGEEWQKIISLAGGNPRILSFLLQAACPSPGVTMEIDTIFRALQTPMNSERARRLLHKAWQLISPQYYATYKLQDQLILVLMALYKSLLGAAVKRTDHVWEGKFEDRWMDMESEGLVALISIQTCGPDHKRRRLRSTSRQDDGHYVVAFSPMMAYHIVDSRLEKTERLWPRSMVQPASAWTLKENSDLQAVVFMLKLKSLLCGNTCSFVLGDILPGPDVQIPATLGRANLYLPNGGEVSWEVCKVEHQLHDKQSFDRIVNSDPKIMFYMFTHNDRTDSMVRLSTTSTRDGHNFFVLIESRSRFQVDKTIVHYQDVKKKLLKNKRSWGVGTKFLACVYWSDENTSVAKAHQGKDELKMDEMDKRIVIGGKYPKESPFQLFAALRHIQEYVLHI